MWLQHRENKSCSWRQVEEPITRRLRQGCRKIMMFPEPWWSGDVPSNLENFPWRRSACGHLAFCHLGIPQGRILGPLCPDPSLSMLGFSEVKAKGIKKQQQRTQRQPDCEARVISVLTLALSLISHGSVSKLLSFSEFHFFISVEWDQCEYSSVSIPLDNICKVSGTWEGLRICRVH